MDFFDEIKKHKMALTGLIIMLIVFIIGILAPLIAPYDPFEMNVIDRLSPPSQDYIFGTDNYGRDIFSRSLYGIRISVIVGLNVVIFTSIFGTVIGALAGYFPKFDNIIMRLMDALMSFPTLLLGIAIVAILGPSALNAAIALSIVYTPRTTRIVRGSVLEKKNADFVIAARALGANDVQIIFRHILRNCMAPLIVQSTFIFAYAILAEASLSFVGAGPPPPAPSLGNIISEGRDFLRVAPWYTILPGVFIAFSVLGLNLAGDGLRDILDPKMKQDGM